MKRVGRIHRTVDSLSRMRGISSRPAAFLAQLNTTRRACVTCGTLEILVHAAPGVMIVCIRAPLLTLPYEIEVCFDQVATAIARVEDCQAAELGAMAWEWVGESKCDYFVLRRPCLTCNYPRAIERELRAVVSGTRRETLH
jgi:hypothetical protein